VPNKIRKIELFDKVGLPTPETKLFKRESISAIWNYIKNTFSNERPLIIRVAGIPDKFSRPYFYVDKKENLPKIFDKLKNLLFQMGVLVIS